VTGPRTQSVNGIKTGPFFQQVIWRWKLLEALNCHFITYIQNKASLTTDVCVRKEPEREWSNMFDSARRSARCKAKRCDV